MHWFKQLVTGKDNQTHDLGRWSWLISMAAVIGHTIWAAYNKSDVDIMQLSQALSIIAGAHGASLWAKSKTEPDNTEEKKE